jgi:hypothetical protein
MKMPRRFLLLAIGAVVGVLCFAAGLSFVVFGILPFFHKHPPVPFDAKLWQENTQKATNVSDNIRRFMVQDLVKNHLSTGMTNGELRVLLGDPEAHPEHVHPDNFHPDTLMYFIGSDDWLGYDYLQISLDRSERVKEIVVRVDGRAPIPIEEWKPYRW